MITKQAPPNRHIFLELDALDSETFRACARTIVSLATALFGGCSISKGVSKVGTREQLPTFVVELPAAGPISSVDSQYVYVRLAKY